MNGPKKCDNKSVGVIIRKEDNFAVIKKKNFPRAYAFVAGHLDGNTYEAAALKEVREEAGIYVMSLKLKLEEKYFSPCKREGGEWHNWRMYEAEKWSGEIQAGSDTMEAFWTTRNDLTNLAQRTLYFSDKLNIPADNLAEFVPAISENPQWQKDPGLEPIWLIMLQKIGII